ncbi:MAG: biotin-dependent carboxyltransferase family protein [Reichenbachiella sp.]
MSRSLKIISHGIQSSIQDGGRVGYRNIGVPISGAMDQYSMRLANALLGNDIESAVIEMICIGGKFEFLCDTHIVISGADFSPKLNAKSIELNKPYQVTSGDILSFGKPKYGQCAYLGIKGGVNSRVLLGSRSHMSGITSFERLMKGRALDIIPHQSSLKSINSKVSINKDRFNQSNIVVLKGPEYEDHYKDIENQTFSIDISSSRMAYLFKERINLKSTYPEMLTSAVMPGTVQLTPSGQLIVLMRDCQTTGGYPRIFQLTEDSINILSQKRVGHTISFTISK